MTTQVFHLAAKTIVRGIDTPQINDTPAILSLIVPATLAVILVIAAQGTTPAADMPDWHGNVAVSDTLAVQGQ